MTAIATKERPILFSGEMVKAILVGRKTMTRRVVKPQPVEWRSNVPGCEDLSGLDWKDRIFEADSHLGGLSPDAPRLEDFCPYGKPGDRLWVRETWNVDDVDSTTWMGGGENWGPFKLIPKSRPSSCWIKYQADDRDWDISDRWRPSIHMPRWASRITLEIADVRMEPLREITEQDAIEEGVGPGYMPNAAGSTSCVGHRPMFVRRWNEINGKRGFSWESNPWVWVVTFRREHE